MWRRFMQIVDVAWQFIHKGDTTSASCVCIAMTNYVSESDAKGLADYFKEVAKANAKVR